MQRQAVVKPSKTQEYLQMAKQAAIQGAQYVWSLKDPNAKPQEVFAVAGGLFGLVTTFSYFEGGTLSFYLSAAGCVASEAAAIHQHGVSNTLKSASNLSQNMMSLFAKSPQKSPTTGGAAIVRQEDSTEPTPSLAKKSA